MKHVAINLLFALVFAGGLFSAFAAPPDPGWAQIWGDEFDGSATNMNQYGLNLDNWSCRLPWKNDGGNDRWFSQNDAHWIADDSSLVTNGTLVIRAQTSPPTTWPGHSTFYYKTGWTHSSGKFQYTYGYAETSLQSPNGSAMWPAWWFLGVGWPPEVDAFERYPNGNVHQGVYYYAPTNGGGVWASYWANGDAVYSMNTWGFEWSPSFMGFSKNGVIRNGVPTPYSISQPLFMVFSGGVVTNGAGGGSLASQSFPADFVIDYVRVYKRAEHLYNGDFSAGFASSGQSDPGFSPAAAWTLANTNTTISTNAGPSGGCALVLMNGADSITPSSASQPVYGLVPGARYWVSANLKGNGSPVYLGVNWPGGTVEQATTSSNYTNVSFIFTNGLNNTAASVDVRLDAGANLNGNAVNVQIRRAAAVADPGFELNNAALYWPESYGGYSVATNSRSGNRCLALTSTWSAAQQTIYGLLPNTTYQLSGWINSGGTNCYLGVNNFGGTETNQAVKSTSYTQATITFTTGSTNTTALIYAWLPALGSAPAYGDDWLLTEVLASPWQQTDIGSVGLAGVGGSREGGFDIRGAGSDIWGTADSFRFVWQPVTNDCRIIARVAKLDPTDLRAKAGVMLREGLTAGARQFSVGWIPQQYIESLWRSTTNGPTSSQWSANKVSAPAWVKLERAGNNFTAAWSPDGVHWTTVTNQTLALPATIYAGLEVCAHNPAQLNEALFAYVSVGGLTNRVADDLNWNGSTSWDTGSANWLNSSSVLTIWSNAVGDGATFGATGATTVSLATNVSAGSLTFNSPGYVLTDKTLTLAGPNVTANATATIVSTLAGSAGLNKFGADVLTLSGTNTYSGGTTISAGTLKLQGNSTLGSSNNPVNVFGGIWNLGGNNYPAGTVTIAGGVISNGTLTAASLVSQSGEVCAVIAGAGMTLTKTTGGTLTLSGANAYSGGTVLNDGELSIASAMPLGGSANPLNFAGGTLQITGASLNNLNSQNINWSTFDGAFDIADAGNTFTITNTIGGKSLTKAGTGTLLLTGASTYTGDTIIGGGALQISPAGRLYGNGGGSITVESGGMLSVSGNVGYSSQALGNLDASAGGIVLDGGTFQHTGTGNAKSGQPGAGRLLMLVEGGGTLESATAAQEFSLGYRYDFGANILSPVGGTLTLAGVGNGDLNYGLGGTGGLIKNGTGTWKLTGTNYFYSSNTVVNAGTLLLVQGNISNSPVTVAGGTFGGTGNICQPVTVQTGGTLAPGVNAIGTLAVAGNVTLAAGSRTLMKINASSGANDFITGINISYGGTLVVSNLAGTVATNQSYQLFSAASTTGSFAAISPTNPVAGLTWWFTPTNGTLRALPSALLMPANLVCSVRGTNLFITWPGNHLGWRLEAQTNSLSAGIGTNWFTVSGSAATNQISFPPNTGNGSMFFRLAYP